MTRRRNFLSALSGAVAVVLFALGSIVIGERPGFDASAGEVASHLVREQGRVQVGVALLVLAMPFFVLFLVTAVSLAGERARRAGLLAFGCGVVLVALFLADVTTLTVAALRPARLAEAPELARALRDVELLLMGAAAPIAATMLAALAALPAGRDGLWPRRISQLGTVAAFLYLLRTGTLFTADGVFAADGLLGLYVPVAALLAWTLVASIALARDVG